MKIFLGFLVFFVLFIPYVYGENDKVIITKPKPTSSYDLPYPGLQPDNPLYIIKNIRDSIIELIINNSLKKAEFLLLQSDKYMSSAGVLVEQGKYQLVSDMIIKSNMYLDRSLNHLSRAQAQKMDTAGVYGKMKSALLKRYEVFYNIRQFKIDENTQNIITKEEKKLKNFEKRIIPHLP